VAVSHQLGANDNHDVTVIDGVVPAITTRHRK
jgi:hypothetical protein